MLKEHEIVKLRVLSHVLVNSLLSLLREGPEIVFVMGFKFEFYTFQTIQYDIALIYLPKIFARGQI